MLPMPTPPLGSYVRAMRSGDLLFVSGHLPEVDGQSVFWGTVGTELTVEEGYQAARLSAINALGTIHATLGNLDRVRRIVKLFGMVNSAPGFTGQTQVINGASDFLVEVFGEAGTHARSAVGMAELPRGNAVEIELIVEIVSG